MDEPRADASLRGRRTRARRWFGLAFAFLAVGAPFAVSPHTAADAQPAQTVLVFYTSYKGMTPFEQFHERFLAVLQADQSRQVDVQAEFIDVMVPRGDEYEQAVIEYVRRKYEGVRIDAVVGVSAPGIRIAAKVRAALFPSAPLVYGAVDQKVARVLALGTNVTGVTSTVDIPGTAALAYRLLPDTTHIAVVGGDSVIERAWHERILEEVRDVDSRVEVIDLFALDMEELLRRLATLPPDTVVLWTVYYRDAKGTIIAPKAVIAKAYQASNAPIFGIYEHDLGNGIVGGSLGSFSRRGEDTGALVLRILNGEQADAIPVIHEGDNPIEVDWREVERWRIDERRLPPGTVVLFREPTVWDQYKWFIMGGVAVILAETLLIVGLVIQRSRRRRAQQALAGRLRVEQLVAQLSARFADLAPDEIGPAIAEGLEAVRDLFSVDRASLVRFGDGGGAEVAYSSVALNATPLAQTLRSIDYPEVFDRLRQGSVVRFSHLDEIARHMPRSREAFARTGVHSFVALPLHVGGAILGAFGLASSTAPLAPGEIVPQLQILTDIFSNAFVRERSSAELHRSEALGEAVLGSITAQVCVLDRDGRVIAVNDAWKRASAGPGADVAFRLAGEGLSAVGEVAATPDTARAREGIRSVLDGSRDAFSMEYRVSAPTADSWYQLTAERLRLPEGGAVVSNQNVTSRKRAELESEQRRQELAHVSRVSTMGELAASIAHELNQPLTGVLTNAQAALRFLAHDPPNVGELREILDDIVDDDRRAGEVIRRLRSLLQTGAIEPVDLEINEIVGEVLKLLGSDAILRLVTIESDLAPGLPSVCGDRIQLQQVVLNLIINAMDAMKETSPTERRVMIRTMATDPQTVLLSIVDKGPGIEKEKLGRIFQAFFTTKADGLGMGLSIARTIVEAHGGMLWATNNPDRGASFHCRLPASQEAADPSEEVPAAKAREA